MSDKNTIDPDPSTASDDLPAFVRQVAPDGCLEFDLENLHCWSPEKSGLPSLDYQWGRSHAGAALEYSRRHGTPVFLLFVLMTMRGRPVEAMERGFIDVLVTRALSGAVPPPISDETMAEIAGLDVPAFRRIEDFMASTLRADQSCQRDPAEPLAGYVVELLDGVHGEWIGGGIFMLAGAAMNGSLN